MTNKTDIFDENYIRQITDKWLTNIVIPQVYDDSLSYYEEINKILGCLNEMGDAFKTLPDVVQKILQDTGKLEVVTDVYTAIAPVEEKECSSTNKEAGDLMWLKKDGNSTLYECITKIDAGTIFVIGKNIKEVDINTKIKYLYEIVSNNNEHYNKRAEYTHDINSLFIYKDRIVKANTRINVDDMLTDKYNITSISEYVFNNLKNIETNKTEIANLKQADITLQNHIDDEVGARTAGIENVNSAINTEKEARISADNATNQKLAQETTELTSKIANNTSQITNLNNMLGAYWKTIYPIGSIYVSTSATFNPQSTWGGTWVKTGEGRCLIGANATYPLGSTGGEAKHLLTTTEMPPHNHRFSKPAWTNSEYEAGNRYFSSYGLDKTCTETFAETETTGGNTAHNNMQPYLAVYMWERIA